MAATTSKKSSKPVASKSKKKKFSVTSLIAISNNTSQAVDVSFIFKSGIGQATASLFRNGVLINMQSISSTGSIHFSEVQHSDAISVNGVCAGTCDITVSVPTTPPTPVRFNPGIILSGFLIN